MSEANLTPTVAGVLFYFVIPTISLLLLTLSVIGIKYCLERIRRNGLDPDITTALVALIVFISIVLLACANAYDKAKTCAPPLWNVPSVKIITK